MLDMEALREHGAVSIILWYFCVIEEKPFRSFEFQPTHACSIVP